MTKSIRLICEHQPVLSRNEQETFQNPSIPLQQKGILTVWKRWSVQQKVCCLVAVDWTTLGEPQSPTPGGGPALGQ